MMGATIYIKDWDEVISISEGTGENLDSDDVDNGYVDYLWYNECDPITMEILDGGMILETELVADLYTSCASKECVKRVIDFIAPSSDPNGVNMDEFEYEILEDE